MKGFQLLFVPQELQPRYDWNCSQNRSTDLSMFKKYIQLPYLNNHNKKNWVQHLHQELKESAGEHKCHPGDIINIVPSFFGFHWVDLCQSHLIVG